MNAVTNRTLRAGLPPLPDRMKALPLDHRGYPVPFFVKWNNGVPDFRLLDEEKFIRCLKFEVCSICGDKLGIHRTFAGGPMNAIQQISGEPPMHHDCALFAVKSCPFLLHPLAKRRDSNLPENIREIGEAGDVFYEGNPGITSLWTCTAYHLSASNRVFHFDNVKRLEWFTQGRPATMEEITKGLHEARDRLMKIRSGEQP